jgi:hypothetical protein
MKLLQSILSVAGLVSVPSPNMSDSLPALPTDHPASIQLSAWLAAFNTADRDTILAYHTDLNFPISILGGGAQAVEVEIGFARATGGFDVVKIECIDDPSFVVVVLEEKGYPQHVRVNMSVDIFRPSYPVTKFRINPTVIPFDLIPKDDPQRPEYEKAMAPLTPVRRQAVLDGVVGVLRDHYINPTVGEDIISALEANHKNHHYESIDYNEELAIRLTLDLRSRDKDMFVRFCEPRLGRRGSEHGPTPKKQLEHLRLMNFGFGNASFDNESVPGRTIATLPIDAFVPVDKMLVDNSEVVRAAVGNKISSIADADAVILDLRDNYGGPPGTVAFVESYFLDHAPLHLLDMVDRNGLVERSFSSLPIDELPPGSKRFGGDKPLFILTSEQTFAGGEDLAYTLQAFKRSQAVIGDGNDATAGAAKPITRTTFIAEDVFGKEWWFVGIPNARPIHAVTGSNWEGVGVKSDIVAGKGEWEGVTDAAEVARQLAARALQRDKEL